MSECVAECIETLEIQNRSSEKSEMTLTFYSDVRLCRVVYLDTRNSEQKL